MARLIKTCLLLYKFSYCLQFDFYFLFLDQAMLICMTLAANRLLIAEDSSAGLYQKIILNATVDDLHYALNVS